MNARVRPISDPGRVRGVLAAGGWIELSVRTERVVLVEHSNDPGVEIVPYILENFKKRGLVRYKSSDRLIRKFVGTEKLR
jgi:hypothetical protein